MNNFLQKLVRNSDLFDCDVPFILPILESVKYPWEILPRIGDYITCLMEKGITGYVEYAPGILIGENVTIHPSALISPNVIIGPNTQIRPGAFIRGNVIIGPDCVIGNSTELKNSILISHVQVPHYNYVGDSIIGSYAHLGAGAICSNLKSDKQNIIVHGDREYETHLRKMGGIIGDHVEIGCHCVINPGTIIGKYTNVYPLTSVRGVIPAHCILKSAEVLVEKNSNSSDVGAK